MIFIAFFFWKIMFRCMLERKKLKRICKFLQNLF